MSTSSSQSLSRKQFANHRDDGHLFREWVTARATERRVQWEPFTDSEATDATHAFVVHVERCFELNSDAVRDRLRRRLHDLDDEPIRDLRMLFPLQSADAWFRKLFLFVANGAYHASTMEQYANLRRVLRRYYQRGLADADSDVVVSALLDIDADGRDLSSSRWRSLQHLVELHVRGVLDALPSTLDTSDALLSMAAQLFVRSAGERMLLREDFDHLSGLIDGPRQTPDGGGSGNGNGDDGDDDDDDEKSTSWWMDYNPLAPEEQADNGADAWQRIADEFGAADTTVSFDPRWRRRLPLLLCWRRRVPRDARTTPLVCHPDAMIDQKRRADGFHERSVCHFLAVWHVARNYETTFLVMSGPLRGVFMSSLATVVHAFGGLNADELRAQKHGWRVQDDLSVVLDGAWAPVHELLNDTTASLKDVAFSPHRCYNATSVPPTGDVWSFDSRLRNRSLPSSAASSSRHSIGRWGAPSRPTSSSSSSSSSLTAARKRRRRAK